MHTVQKLNKHIKKKKKKRSGLALDSDIGGIVGVSVYVPINMLNLCTKFKIFFKTFTGYANHCLINLNVLHV